MANNQAPRRNEEPDRPMDENISSGSDVDEVRNETPGASRPLRTETPDQPETIDTPNSSVREPGKGPRDDITFDENPAMRDDDSARPAKAGALGTGMFFPVVILLIIAVIVIIWIVM